MTAKITPATQLGRFVTSLDLSSPDLCYHDPPKVQKTRSMEANALEDSDEWLKNAVSTIDINTRETRRWIEMAVERGDSIFVIVGYGGKLVEGVRFRKVLHRWLSSSETALHRLSNPWWTSLAVYKCVGWLEDHDIIQVMLTDDLRGERDVKEMS